MNLTSAQEYIAFGWWNTSLSPPRKPNRASPADRDMAVDIIKFLLADCHIDCLGVGEVTSDDLAYIASQVPASFALFDGTEKAGRTQFDTGLFYNQNKLAYLDRSCHTDDYAGNVLKIANRVSFATGQNDPPLHVLVSHWPSRGWCDEHSAKKHTIGVRLLDVVKGLRTASAEEPLFVLLGDYNDEPFNETLEGMLLATRDRRLVRASNGYVYNPFWRCIGEPDGHVPGMHRTTFSGTCYHKTGDQTQWRTFDQIMFSSRFLCGGRWQLDETHTRVLQISPLTALITQRDSIFDHFPVMSVVVDAKEVSSCPIT